jgi:hypothetical protein
MSSTRSTAVHVAGEVPLLDALVDELVVVPPPELDDDAVLLVPLVLLLDVVEPPPIAPVPFVVDVELLLPHATAAVAADAMIAKVFLLIASPFRGNPAPALAVASRAPGARPRGERHEARAGVDATTTPVADSSTSRLLMRCTLHAWAGSASV